jgi:hypothetical protein
VAKQTPGQKAYAARNKAAQRAGFRSYYHYRKETARPEVRRIVRKSGIEKGRDRYEIAALASNVKKLPGRPGSKRRDKKAGILSDKMRQAGRNPTFFWRALGSPKRRKK